MKLQKSTTQEFIKSASKLSGKISDKLDAMETRVKSALNKVSTEKKIDFYGSLVDIQGAKNQIISNTITEIHTNGRRTNKEDKTTREVGEGQTG